MVIFTTAFPLDPIAEVSFVRPELEPLARRFDRVILVPAVVGELRCELPDGVAVDHSLAETIHPRSALARKWLAAEAVRSGWLHAEIRRCPRLVVSPAALRRFVFCAGAARRIGTWLEARFGSGSWDPSATLLYTYWMNYVTAGLGRARRRYPGLRLVSRAHGADIYEDRYRPPCFPLHPFAIAAADRVFAASQAGRDHLAQRYPAHRDTLSVAPLGTPEPRLPQPPLHRRLLAAGLVQLVLTRSSGSTCWWARWRCSARAARGGSSSGTISAAVPGRWRSRGSPTSTCRPTCAGPSGAPCRTSG